MSNTDADRIRRAIAYGQMMGAPKHSIRRSAWHLYLGGLLFGPRI